MVTPRSEVDARPLASAFGFGLPSILVERERLLELAAIGAAVAGLGFWLLGLSTVSLGGLTDLGLVSVLPVWSYLAFIPVAGAFAFGSSRARTATVVLAVSVVVLVLMLYGLGPIVEGTPRFSPTYRHLGIIDYVTRHGSVDPTIDAYHNWPGMFILASAVAGAAGIPDLTWIATWAPVWFNLLYLPPLFVLLDSLTDDRRVVWLGIWLFYLTDWIGQDYFAPQAAGFLIFLTGTALLVRWLAAREARDPEGGDGGRSWWLERAPSRVRSLVARVRPIGWLLERLSPGSQMRASTLSPARRVGLVAIYVGLFAFVVTGHQLTPFFMLAGVAVLLILGRVRWVSLPVLMSVLVTGWVAFMAVVFLIGHFQNVAGYVGTLSDSLAANLTGRLSGSFQHQVVVYARLAFTAAVWLVAIVGVGRRLRAGRWDVTTVALAVAPFPLFAVQAYGGEMLLRIHLFSLPFMVMLAGFALLPRRTEVLSAGLAAAIFATSLILVPPFVLTRYGNERIESFTRGEVAAVDELYRIAPKGSLLVGVVGNLPWKTTRYEEYRYRPIGSDTYFDDLDGLLSEMADYPGPSYLIITRTQEAYAEMILGATPGQWASFRQQILESGRFEVISTTADATVARYVPVSPAP